MKLSLRNREDLHRAPRGHPDAGHGMPISSKGDPAVTRRAEGILNGTILTSIWLTGQHHSKETAPCINGSSRPPSA
jgi:hypothetical protein